MKISNIIQLIKRLEKQLVAAQFLIAREASSTNNPKKTYSSIHTVITVIPKTTKA